MTDHIRDRLAADLAVCEAATDGPLSEHRTHPDFALYDVTNESQVTVAEGLSSEDAEFFTTAHPGYPLALRALQAVMESIDRDSWAVDDRDIGKVEMVSVVDLKNAIREVYGDG